MIPETSELGILLHRVWSWKPYVRITIAASDDPHSVYFSVLVKYTEFYRKEDHPSLQCKEKRSIPTS